MLVLLLTLALMPGSGDTLRIRPLTGSAPMFDGVVAGGSTAPQAWRSRRHRAA